MLQILKILKRHKANLIAIFFMEKQNYYQFKINQKLKHIKNYDKRLDMEKHPFILIITIQFISIFFIHY